MAEQKTSTEIVKPAVGNFLANAGLTEAAIVETFNSAEEKVLNKGMSIPVKNENVKQILAVVKSEYPKIAQMSDLKHMTGARDLITAVFKADWAKRGILL
jgi:ribosomal protein L11